MKKLTTLLLLLCLATGLFGVAGVQAGGDSITIEYLYNGVIDFTPTKEAFEAMYKEKTGIDVTIDVTMAPGDDWMDTLKTAVAAGGGPDVWHMDVNWFSAWQDVVIQPLSIYLGDEIFGEYSANGIDLWKAEGKYYALPITYSVVAMMYNVDLAAEIGIEIKEDWTFEDFEAALEKAAAYLEGKTVTYTDGNEYPYYILGHYHTMYFWWLMTGPFGGTALADTNNIAQKAFADAILKMSEWRSKGWIWRRAEVQPGGTQAAFSDALNVLFWPTGDWTITGLTRQELGIESDPLPVKVNYASVQMPSGEDDKPHSEIYNQGVVLNKNLSGEKAQAAAEFIQYITNDAWDELFGHSTHNYCLPGRIDWMEQYPGWLLNPAHGKGFLDTLDHGIIHSPDYNAGGLDLTSNLQEVVETAFRAVDENPGAFDADAVYKAITDALEAQQALINVQLVENDIQPDNPDGKLK